MQLSASVNFDQVLSLLDSTGKQGQYATMVAINKSAEVAKDAVARQLPIVFDRPTSWVLNSLRIQYAKDRAKPVAQLAFKDKSLAVSARTMIFPHVEGGARHFKAMEARLSAMGFLPKDFNAVPGGGAILDGNGNMSRGQISQLLNVLGTYTESGFNKANLNTRKRLAKGNVKQNKYGFEYFVSYGKIGRTSVGMKGGEMAKTQTLLNHLAPGVYQRVKTGFGTSIKPILIFVRRAQYRKRLDFYNIAQDAFNKSFPGEFKKSFDDAMRTAIPRGQGTVS